VWDSGRFVVYILASRKYGAIYTGVTGNLPKRIYIHREALIPGFSSRYKTYRLVYFEQHADPRSAILREKQIKKWNRAWKIRLLEESNPNWDDLYDSLFG
jgi:putative endonuclease